MELYVHLPFCRQKCRYCDFVSFSGMEGKMEAYVHALLREAELVREDAAEPVETVYFGGGTPSLLPPALLTALAEGLKKRLPMDSVAEWTVEANPGTGSALWLESARSLGISRISFGMQAAQDRLLKAIGRIHDMRMVRDSVRAARAAGFSNLNLDLIFGLPSQTMADWRETLEAALDLQPEHISAYGLIPEEGTPLFRDLREGRIRLPEVEEERDMYGLLLQVMEKHGFRQYEISNFAKPGFACRHNIGYWDQVPYLGLGLSAASMVNVRSAPDGMRYLRRTNTREMNAWLEGIREGRPVPAEREEISPGEARFETLMLGLRMNRGVSGETFQLRHGVPLEPIYGKKLRDLAGRGLVRFDAGCWRLTREGMDLQNTVLVELMD